MIKNDRLVSIISPVYNVEKHIKKAINSVLKQKYKNWELLMVDDDSPDNSPAVIKKFIKRDGRIKLLRNARNMGADYSRFKGLDAARGTYIMFLDPDDWLSGDAAIDILVNKIEAETADVVCGAHIKMMDQFGFIQKQMGNLRQGTFRTASLTRPVLFDEFFESYFSMINSKLLPYMWGKLYRKAVIDKADLQPTRFKFREDLMFNLKLHPYLQKIAFVSDNIVHYRWGGVVTKMNLKHLADLKKEYEIKKEIVAQYEYLKVLPLMKDDLVYNFYLCFNNMLLSGEIKEEELKLTVENELKDPFYVGKLEVIKRKKARALWQGNIDQVVDFIEEEYHKVERRYKIKRIIFSLLNLKVSSP